NRLRPSSPRAFAFLLYLAAHRGREIPRATLQELLFPRSPERNAAHSLRQLTYRLRGIGAPILTDDDSASLPVDSVRLDFLQLFEGAAPGDAVLERLALGFLPAYQPSLSATFGDWLDSFRTDISVRVCRVIVRHLRHLREGGRWERVAVA